MIPHLYLVWGLQPPWGSGDAPERVSSSKAAPSSAVCSAGSWTPMRKTRITGATQPVVRNSTPESRQQNRRGKIFTGPTPNGCPMEARRLPVVTVFKSARGGL